MTRNETLPLDEDQKREFCTLLVLGCDRETACKYVGCSLDELREAVNCDADFGKRLLRAEATAELRHMRNVHTITENPKEWRASIWWLERRAPERFARGADALPAGKLRNLIAELACAIGEEVTHQEDRQRMVIRLLKITDSLDEMFAAQAVAQVFEDDVDEEQEVAE